MTPATRSGSPSPDELVARSRKRHFVRRQVLERLHVAQVLVIGDRPAAADAAVRVHPLDPDETLRIAEGQRFEQEPVDDAEDGGVGADPESEDEDRDERERGLPPKLAQRVSDVEQEALDGRPLPDFAAALFERRDVAEFAAGGGDRVFSRQAALHERVDLLVEMLADLVGEVAIDLAARNSRRNQFMMSSLRTRPVASTRRMPSNIRSKLDVSRCRCLSPAGVTE